MGQRLTNSEVVWSEGALLFNVFSRTGTDGHKVDLVKPESKQADPLHTH